jgi:hypothetical protein
MFKKAGHSFSEITPLNKEAVLADPLIIERMTKLAHEIKSIAPKSDDFLYFSIIFLKAAESALLDEKGDLKKLGHEKAWGYFDENWKWHGNVKPHKNNNNDIFPEIELKKAAHDWIGKPLCKDHKSDSVDGVRGIILDTHYDEKLKQVVGLCALDRVNYADLARKVETGIVRYGSMGTAVEVSVCSECGNRAKTANQYCDHIQKRAAWGEINVGLKPIEYSLVVQPAESGAVLLKCIASLQQYRDEFTNYGVEDFEEMIGTLSLSQAQHLDSLVKTACGDNGCSIPERRKIITSFLKKNNLLKISSEDTLIQGSPQNMDRFTSGQTVNSPVTGLTGSDDSGVIDYTGSSGSLFASVSEPNEFDAGGVLPGDDYSERITHTSKNAFANNGIKMLSTIMEDIMNESSLKKRAELRRKLAYHQGGSEGVEPKTYKSEEFGFEEDKHMKQVGKMGGDDGTFPGDQAIKQKLSRAKLEERRLRRLAYYQGGSDGIEPKTYKSEEFGFEEDKHMMQTGKMGGDSGMFPGDEQVKQKLKRAAYNGPALSTKLSWAVRPNGQINKSASVFEVYAGNRKVIAASGHEIFGNEVAENWDWFTSKDYGQEVCKQIRASGLGHVTMLLKGAQEAPAEPVPPPPAPPAPDMGAGAPADIPPPDEGMADSMPESDSKDQKTPKQVVEDSLVSIEEAVASARDALGKIEGGGSVTVNIDAEQGAAEAEGESGEVKLSSEISRQLKIAIAELDEAGDELAMIAETYENSHRLASHHIAELNKVANESLRDAERLLGQTSSMVKMANSLSNSIRKVATNYSEDHAMDNYQTMSMNDLAMDEMHALDQSDLADDMDMGGPPDGIDPEMLSMDADDSSHPEDDAHDLVSHAMDLRRARREGFLVQAAKKKAKAPEGKMPKGSSGEKEEKSMSKKEKAMSKKEESKDDSKDEAKTHSKSAALKEIVSTAFDHKKAEQDREVYKLKLRRAYDVAIEMQKKGLIGLSKTALDKQVDDIMDFDDKAFEAFKRSVANAKSISNVKVATDLGGINVGVESSESTPAKSSTEVLKMLWE